MAGVRPMRLSDASGSVFELTVTGYQFPKSTFRPVRYSWHMVKGAVTFEGESWSFHWQALTCDETPMVSAWLRSAADWIDATDTGEGLPAAMPTPLFFTEPNLAFRLAPSHVADHAEVQIQLRQEFRLPSRRHAPSSDGAVPILAELGDGRGPFDQLRITSSAAELGRAADEWDSEWAPYPDGTIGLTRAELKAELQERRASGRSLWHE